MRIPVRPIVFCLLSLHLALVCGIPLPVPRIKNENAERFPCENCPCGCSSAAFCWDKCCCHTDQEKLVWAKQNGVRPPDFLIARTQGKSGTNPQIAIAKTCCTSAKSKTSCCTDAQAAQVNLATSNEHGCGCSSSCNKQSDVAADVENDEEQVDARLVLLDPALKCRGIEIALTLFSKCWIPDSDSTVAPPAPLCIGWMENFDEVSTSIYLPVDVPVPRVV